MTWKGRIGGGKKIRKGKGFKEAVLNGKSHDPRLKK